MQILDKIHCIIVNLINITTDKKNIVQTIF